MRATIRVSQETKELLRRFGHPGETDDDIIRRLLEDLTWKALDDHWNRILEDDALIPLHEL